MRWMTDMWFRLRALVGRRRMERELDEEVAFHLEREAEKLQARGMSPEEARRTARLRFGGVDRQKEAAREAWGVGLLTDLGADLRYALRQLGRAPAFSAVAVLTLALGIGGTVALGSVAWGILLRPLPVEDEEELVTFWSAYNWRGAEFDHVRERVRAFEGLAAWSNEGFSLRVGDGPSSLVPATVASAELFDVLGARPLLGRTFRPGDDRPGAEPVVILSHGLWMDGFGGDPGVVGRRVFLDGEPTTVVGVMPERFHFPTPRMRAWVPLDLDPDDPAYHGNGWLVLTGRLRDGTGEDGVQAELERITQALDQRFDYPAAWDKTENAQVTPLRTYLLGDVRPAVLLLLGAVGILLLMACANVAALLLTRSRDRVGELGVRATLGAGRGRLARQLLTESVVLSSLGGLLGVALAAALFDVLVAALPLPGGLEETLSLGAGALGAALVLAVAVGALVSLAPIRHLLQGRLAGLAGGARTASGSGPGAGRAHGTLVFAEVALAVVLLNGAALLVRSVGELRDLDPGLDPDGVLVADVYLGPGEAGPDERAAFFERVLERAAALPGVSSAGFINRVPIRDAGYQGTIPIEDRPDLEGPDRPNAAFRTVSPGLFEAFDFELVEGRGIGAGDRAGSPPVAVVNETFARRMWPGESALGKRIGCNLAEGWFEVVGVVRNVAVHDLTSEAPMAAYYARAQVDRDSPGVFAVLEAAGDPAALTPALRRLVAEADPRAVVGRAQTMEEVVDAGMAENLRLRFFLLLFAGLGLGLGVVGVYGVVSYTVDRRRAEFGIRMALGARPAGLLARVVRTGMVPVAAGVVAGLATALLASRLLSGILFGVAPTDPASFVTAAGVILLAGAMAAALPALRAGRTDPADALRAE